MTVKEKTEASEAEELEAGGRLLSTRRAPLYFG